MFGIEEARNEQDLRFTERGRAVMNDLIKRIERLRSKSHIPAVSGCKVLPEKDFACMIIVESAASSFLTAFNFQKLYTNITTWQ